MSKIKSFIEAMKIKGYSLIPSNDPNALSIGDYTYTTLVSQNGDVKVAITSGSLYLDHHQRVCIQHTYDGGDLETLVVFGIVCSLESRGNGQASKMLKELLSSTDELKLKVQLEACPMERYNKRGYSKLNKNALLAWYKRLGFVSNENNRTLMTRVAK